MRHRFAVLAAGLTLLALPPAAGAQIVTNGSFENGTFDPCPGPFSGVGSTEITGWTIGTGNMDWICTLWVAADGSKSLDMNGSAPGSIYQDITLTPGATYQLSFAMGENFFGGFGGPDTKTMDVSVGSVGLGSFSFNNPAATPANMGWETHAVNFTANAATMRLTFASTTAGCCTGPALDAVSVIQVSAVPEPAALALLGSGLLGLAGFARRRHA